MEEKDRPFPLRMLGCGLFFYLALQGWFVGLAGVFGSSEARELQVIDVIMRTNDWILPLRNGVVPSKPPLYHWMATLLSIPGQSVSPWTARMTSQVAAVITLLCVAYSGFRFALLTRRGQSTQHAERTAILSAGILSLTYGFFQMGAQAMVDMTFCMCVWLALVSLIYGIQNTRSNSNSPVINSGARIGFWLFCALGILARGPLGVLLPCSLAVTSGVVVIGGTRTLRELLRPSVGWIFLAVPLWWYSAAYQIGGEPFLERQLFFENIQRFTGGKHVNAEAWWFYAPSLLRTSFPWGVLVLALAIRACVSKKKLAYTDRKASVPWIPLLLVGVIVVLFSVSSGKRHSYLLPIIPLIAIQFALLFSTLLDGASGNFRSHCHILLRKVERLMTFFLIGLVLVVALGPVVPVAMSDIVLEAFRSLRPHYERTISVLLIMFLGMSVHRHVTLRSRAQRVWVHALLVLTIVTSSGAMLKSHFKGFYEMSQVLSATGGAGDRFAVIKGIRDEYFDPILFYMKREVTLIQSPSDVRLCNEGTVYLTRAAWFDKHREVLRGHVVEIIRLRERLATLQNDARRELVVFRCRLSRSDVEEMQTARMLSKNKFL